MERQSDNTWMIHTLEAEKEYPEFKTLAQKEAAVPEADKTAIITLLETDIKARNEKNAELLSTLLNPASLADYGFTSKEELRSYYEFFFQQQKIQYTMEKPVIITYEANKATVYFNRTILEAGNPDSRRLQVVSLVTVVKGSDGGWYLNPLAEISLHSELFE
ncbi:hypothetical protein [Paenibacillus sp. sgz500958]|uniref:hypothetical protein n=1 Tax=Paenibacillus sp. sgz500958 TaxID=3242475 RepID=UPI0036D3FBDE